MAGNTTKPYKNTLSGSVGAGMGSLFNPGGRKYYILEHKVTSRYHRAGESQEIIVDNIELGRDSHCQVRFDESFQTVSRHHAAIVKEGDNWKLVQISRTNTTLLNGRPVRTEWYLQNGDEIQLSVNGPKLGFIVPSGSKSTVGSIGLSRRLSLFRQQALRPYKYAISALSILLVLSVGGLTTWNVMQRKDFTEQMEDARQRLENIIVKNAELQKLMDDARKEQARLDSLVKVKPKERIIYVQQKGGNEAEELEKCKKDVYFIRTTKVVVTDGQSEIPLKGIGWMATGFLLADGRFVTAKHCVEGWKFGSLPSDKESLSYMLSAMSSKNQALKIVAYMEARSKFKTLYFKSTDFVMNHSTEVRKAVLEDVYIITSPLDKYDWAYAPTNQKGDLQAGDQLSANLPTGVDLHILGFPHGWGAIDTKDFNCLYGSCKTARSGLDADLIRVSARNYEPGNSGGPVLYNDGGQMKVVGIVSSHLIQNKNQESSHGNIVPIMNLKK